MVLCNMSKFTLMAGSHILQQVRLKLRTQLTGLRPVEVVLPRRGSECMTAVTSRLCRCGGSRGPAPALNELPASCADAGLAVKVGRASFSMVHN